MSSLLPDVDPLRRATLTDEVYTRIRALIMDHRLAPGGRVGIDDLARRLEVSPTPVREALARLEADGLVRRRPLAGYTVAPLLSRAEFEELFDLRLLLEPAAAARAAERHDLVDAAGLRLAAALPAAEPGEFADYGDFTSADAAFHDLIASLSANSLLRQAISRLHSHLHLHRRYFPSGGVDTTQQEHYAIVDSVIAGRAEAAQTAMAEHLRAARARHLPAFE